jgi:hypothetical protein
LQIVLIGFRNRDVIRGEILAMQIGNKIYDKF